MWAFWARLAECERLLMKAMRTIKEQNRLILSLQQQLRDQRGT